MIQTPGPLRAAALALAHGIALRSGTLLVVAVRRPTGEMIILARRLWRPHGCFLRALLSALPLFYILYVDVVGMLLARRLEGVQVDPAQQLAPATLGRGVQSTRWIQRPALWRQGQTAMYLLLSLIWGGYVRTIWPLLDVDGRAQEALVLLTLATSYALLLSAFARQAGLKQRLGYQRAAEATWAQRAQKRNAPVLLPERSLLWAGPRCLFEAGFGGLLVAEAFESATRILGGEKTAGAGSLSMRFCLAGLFALQWGMVLCQKRRLARCGDVARAGSEMLGLMPEIPPGAYVLAQAAWARLEREGQDSKAIRVQPRGLPHLVGARLRERMQRCSTNWWRSKDASRSSIAG